MGHGRERKFREVANNILGKYFCEIIMDIDDSKITAHE